MDEQRTVKALWCLSLNVGDCITPWLIRKMSGKWPVLVPDGEGEHVIACGSMLNWAKPGNTVWGAGLANPSQHVNAAATFVAVRGPMSRAVAVHHNCRVPDVYGDPALLLPKYYKPSMKKTHALGIIPHYLHQGEAVDRYGDRDDVKIIDVFLPVEQFVDAIVSCERIASSSLHGLVIADAYSVPSQWCVFSGEWLTPFKFYDYFASVGVRQYDPINACDVEGLVATMSRYRGRDPKVDTGALWGVCPFRE